MQPKRFKFGFGASVFLVLTLLLTACGATATPAPTVGQTAPTTAPAVSATTAAAKGEMPNPFRVGLIPNQAPDTVKTQYAAFEAYMEKELGIPVDLFVASDYAGVVQAMATDKLDMALFGGVTYVQAKEQADLYPIVTELDKVTKTTKYTSVIIVPADSPAKTVADLKGKTFAFGDISSTSGSLYPKVMLDQAGLKVPQDLKEIKYTGGHDATALAVANGSVDGGGVEERILDRLIEQGKIDKNKIRKLKQSDPIEGYPWVVRAKLDKTFVDKVTNTFLNVKDTELLKLRSIDGYAKITANDYTFVREQAVKFNLLTPKK
jgi:phosphonate transport system substrate-binding protein